MKFGRWLVLGIVAAIALAIDQLVKFTVLDKLSQTGEFYWLNIFNIRFFPNEGVAFGIPLKGPWLVTFLIVVFVILLSLYLKYLRQDKLISVIALGLVLGGAVGNIADRIQLGFVVDYVGIWILPVFNLADIFIILGVLLMIWRIMVLDHHNAQDPVLPEE
ncbi:signal peptidase II [Patescibacteria group bacterium]